MHIFSMHCTLHISQWRMLSCTAFPCGLTATRGKKRSQFSKELKRTQHCTLPIQHCTLHTQHCTLNTAHQHFTLNTFHSILHTQHFTFNTAHSTLHIQHCTLNTSHAILHTQHCTSTLHTQHCKLHTPHFTLYPCEVCNSSQNAFNSTLNKIVKVTCRLNTSHLTLYSLKLTKQIFNHKQNTTHCRVQTVQTLIKLYFYKLPPCRFAKY